MNISTNLNVAKFFKYWTLRGERILANKIYNKMRIRMCNENGLVINFYDKSSYIKLA